MKLYFIKKKKDNLLQGRTIRYLADNCVFCTEVHLYNILNGKSSCSYLLAKNIVECATTKAKVEDYFERR